MPMRILTMISLFTVLPVLALVQATTQTTPAAVPQTSNVATNTTGTSRTLVGVNYFAGWWRETPNKWIVANEDWRPKFPERAPLLGEYNEQATMDKEIVAAADHGVDFFLMLWYYNNPAKPPAEPHCEHLNDGLATFLASPEAHRMRFAIEFCNHPPFSVMTDEEWSKCIDAWMPAFRHPSYLRVGGRLVFKILSGHHFYLVENGSDVERCRKRLDLLRKRVADAGLGEMVIGVGTMAEGFVPADHPFKSFCDFNATYMDVPALAQRPAEYPYHELTAMADWGRIKHAATDVIPYMPYVPASWNCKPWSYADRVSFAFPTREQWTDELRRVKADLENNPNLGISLPVGPNGEKRTQKIFNIYAWNEFGEGGIVAPTQGSQYMMLEGIKEVFGK